MRTTLWNWTLCLALGGVVLPTQVSCLDCGADELAFKYVCDCCHGPGCLGLPGKASQSRITVCAPDEGVALGTALAEMDDRHPEGNSTCGGCRMKGQGEGTGERRAADTADGAVRTAP